MKGVCSDPRIRQVGLSSNHLNPLVQYVQQITLHVDLEPSAAVLYAMHRFIKLQMRYWAWPHLLHLQMALLTLRLSSTLRTMQRVQPA